MICCFGAKAFVNLSTGVISYRCVFGLNSVRVRLSSLRVSASFWIPASSFLGLGVNGFWVPAFPDVSIFLGLSVYPLHTPFATVHAVPVQPELSRCGAHYARCLRGVSEDYGCDRAIRSRDTPSGQTTLRCQAVVYLDDHSGHSFVC